MSPLLSSGLSRDHAIFVLASIVLVLEHLHARHYIYRDVKPENVLVGADGYLKVVDFGFAKRVAPSERTFTVCGTLEYMAPEIIALRGHGPQVSWSNGTYRLVTVDKLTAWAAGDESE